MARRRGQQLGYVHRQGNAWYLAYREDALDADGKIVRVRRHQKIANAKEATKREAQRIARQILGVVDERAQRPMSLVTVQDFIETRFKTDVIWALKHAGQKHYAYVLDKHVLPALGNVRLRDVTSDHVQALVRTKFQTGYSVQTKRLGRTGGARVNDKIEITYTRDFGADRPNPRVRPDGKTADSVPRIARLMALAIRFDWLLRNGTIRDYAELARLGRATRARMTQIMKLLDLAPDIQEQILFLPPLKGLNERNLRSIVSETDWHEQRRIFQEIMNRLDNAEHAGLIAPRIGPAGSK